MKKKILVLDGAMGTAFQDLNLTPSDFGGSSLEGCNENLNVFAPNLVKEVHGKYLAAGCDIIETNTFSGSRIVLDEYDIGDKTHEINFHAARIAREIADEYSTESWPRFVAGAIGPTTKAISVTGGISFQELETVFYEQAKALFEGGADYLLIETSQDSRNIKAAFNGIDRLFVEKGMQIPVALSGTIEPMGTMLAGQPVEALLTSFMHRDLFYIGLNCATGPEFMTDHIRSLSELSPFPVGCVPNAGLPDEDGNYLETPQMVARVIERFIENSWINVIGGCCGTTPEHIAALNKISQNRKPRPLPSLSGSQLSGIDYLEITNEMRPVIVGERTNVIGSRKFKRLICDEQFEEASEVARAQVKNGAQIIDVCLANPDRNELSDMEKFLEITVKKIKAPIMIDSTDEIVIEKALTYCQGKAIINSINLEDGEERFEKVIPLANKYGAALIVGTIDDDPKQGMGVSRERKLEIAKRSHKLLTEKYGVREEDIYWDPLVFPCATGDAQYVGSAVETIEGIKLIKDAFPKTKTVLGISNVSFGLPPAGREVLNSVFLYHCVQSGLDLALVNSEKLERYASIPEDEKKLADDLLFNRGSDPVAAFAAKFRDRKPTSTKPKSDLSLEERLGQYIIEGSKDGLIDDLNLALKKDKPLNIINGPLMAGMDVVGKLFNENKLIVAEVLQSAEAMKTAVAHLESFMDKSETSAKGKVLLATVKGDVHDIGKNLVEIILKNNGFDVVNLGIKIPPEQLIEAIREYNPDIVGLSGLLVKSAQQMVVTADDFAKAGVTTPMMVGGAALSSNFVDRKISKAYSGGTVAYASDAMQGLDLAKSIIDPARFKQLQTSLEERRLKLSAGQAAIERKPTKISFERSSDIRILSQEEIPSPPDFERHVIKNTPIEQIWKFVNPLMLLGRHLGVRGKIVKELWAAENNSHALAEIEKTQPKAFAIWNAVQEVKKEFRSAFTPRCVYQFYSAHSKGNSLFVNNVEIEFPRQRKPNGLCLADYTQFEAGLSDNIALFVTTVGNGIRELSEELKTSGEYLKSHIVQALALESAEAYAELIHSQIRKAWGYADPPEMTMMQRFQAKYHGTRYSFGYPACPRLDDQAILFDLLKPKDIGVELTDGFMMEPEASVSALVFHHPDSKYFSVGQTDLGEWNENRIG